MRRPGRRTRSSRSTARSRRAPRSSAIELSEPLTALPAGFTVQTPPRIAHRPARRRQRARQVDGRHQPGQPALGQRRPVGRPHAPGPEPQAAGRLPRDDRGQGAARLARRTTRRRRWPARAAQTDALRREPEPHAAVAARHRLPPRHRRRRPRRRRPAEQPGRRRHPPAGPEPGRRIPALEPARRPAPPARRHRLRHAGAEHHDDAGGDRVRMVVEPRGTWEHSAYQSDNQFVLEVRAQKVDPNKLVQGAGYAGEKLSLNFQNIEVRALLQVIADFTNFNVVTSDTVTGNVTLRLKDVPWDQALDIILQAKGLGLRKSGNVILIAPKDELNAKEKIELEAKQQIADARAGAHAVVPAQLRQGRGRRQGPDRPEASAAAAARNSAHPVAARQRRLRDAHQPAVRHRHPVQARGSPGPDRQDRHPGAPGADRVAHRRSPTTPSAARSASGSAPSTCAACAAASPATTSAAATTCRRRRQHERRRRARRCRPAPATSTSPTPSS